jgi:microcystin-dependent protein
MDPFVAEIRIMGFNFAPTGWAQCNGQLLPISQNTALFSLLGTFYGGDGKSTFALPDLQGMGPIQPGHGAGLSDRFLGEQGGEPFVTLIQTEMPIHTHQAFATSGGATVAGPSGNIWAQAVSDQGAFNYYHTTGPNPMAFTALAIAGGSLPHNNMMPYLVLNFCISMQGVFPARP